MTSRTEGRFAAGSFAFEGERRLVPSHSARPPAGGGSTDRTVAPPTTGVFLQRRGSSPVGGARSRSRCRVLHARRRPREGPSPCRQTEGTRRRRPRPHQTYDPEDLNKDNFHVTDYDPWAGRESTRGRYRDAPGLSASRNPPHRRPARASTTPSTSSGPCARRGAARASCWSARSTSATCPKAWSTVCR